MNLCYENKQSADIFNTKFLGKVINNSLSSKLYILQIIPKLMQFAVQLDLSSHIYHMKH